MPGAMVRLSAGRAEMTIAEQALCFMAGANSIFAGDKLLTTPNPSFDDDNLMFRLLGLKPRTAFKDEKIAFRFEKYLKSHSGGAFAKKRF